MALQLSCPLPFTATSSRPSSSIPGSLKRANGLRLISRPHATLSRSVRGPSLQFRVFLSVEAAFAFVKFGLWVSGSYDPELRGVLDLATDTELYELHRILFGPSYFSPLLKSIMSRTDIGNVMIEDLDEREAFIVALESRFLFLAADARSTLRGWRPSYRDVLLSVRKKLNIPCSSKLSTEDLEAEIFLHLLQDYSSDEAGIFSRLWENSKATNVQNSLEVGLNQSAVKIGETEFQSIILKGSSLITLAKIYQLLAKKFSGKVFLEAANYQIKKEALRKVGQLAAINLESRAALLAAKQGFAGAASRYVGFRSIMGLLGPILWGTFLADIVIQMLGTDYARILRAIFAFAQIRITRTYHLPSKDD